MGGGGDDDGPVFGADGPYFETQMFFDQDVSGTTKASNSDAIIASLNAAGGWGNGNKMQIDFSLVVLAADASTPKMSFTPTGDFSKPDCDDVPMPVPAGGSVEDEDGYACTGDGDCHLLVFDHDEHSLYEMWRADIEGSTFRGGCLAVWDTQMTYPDTLRGDQCTSADAAGYPMAPLLFTPDEVAAGSIDHAIRFILPNDRPQVGYVRPATHGTDTTGDNTAPYYGVHLRLRADYPIESLPSAGAQVVARAMQKYGMYHADGGNIALTAQSDKYSTTKWDGLLDPHDLVALQVSDFEVIDHGPPIDLTLDCNR
jgi:serine/threonine-protein kinase